MAHDCHFTEISNCDPQGNAGDAALAFSTGAGRCWSRVITLVPEIQLESAPAVKIFVDSHPGRSGHNASNGRSGRCSRETNIHRPSSSSKLPRNERRASTNRNSLSVMTHRRGSMTRASYCPIT